MKKLLFLLIAAMFFSVIPEMTNAQSNDPFEQQTLKARDNTTHREKKISRKKNAGSEVKQEKQTVPVSKQNESKVVEKQKKDDGLTISNPCDEWLDFELVSVIGSKGTQKVQITGKFTNHDMNKSIEVGHRFLAYDSDGIEHSGWTYSSSSRHNTVTDVPVKFTLEIPGKINPSTTQVLPVVSFDIDQCRIDMKNVPINWK